MGELGKKLNLPNSGILGRALGALFARNYSGSAAYLCKPYAHLFIWGPLSVV